MECCLNPLQWLCDVAGTPVLHGEYAGHGRTKIFSAPRNCVQILATWEHALSCWNMRWWRRMNVTTKGLRISSSAFKLPSIKCNCVHCPKLMPAHIITPTPQWGTLYTTLTSANRLPTQLHTHGMRLWGRMWGPPSFWQIRPWLHLVAPLL